MTRMLYLMVGMIVIAGTAFAEWRGMGTTSVTEVKDVPRTVRITSDRECSAHRGAIAGNSESPMK